jgi:ornithine cyclodeaminase/alanine dehydrogenase-like protein (mu-crystallin family)
MDEANPLLKTLHIEAPPTLVLTRADVAGLMTLGDYRAAAEEAFKAQAEGRGHAPPPLHIAVENGGFHAKGARLRTARGDVVAVKLNGNFPGNPKGNGLPTIQGAIILSDAANGCLLAIMDSIEVTLRRTAAASALAAHHLARKGAATLTICGGGDQGRAQLEALVHELKLTHVYVWDINRTASNTFATEMATKIHAKIEPVDDLAPATRRSDVIVTCTTAREAFLDVDHVRPGAFIAAVGADSHDKSEITPALMARGKIVVDVLEQCLTIGDLHHAVKAGAVRAAGAHATLAEIVAGQKPGRTSDSDITIFDSTGTATQDVAAALRIFERAKARAAGLIRHFGDRPSKEMNHAVTD